MQPPKSISGKPQLIAMLHVHSCNAFANTPYNNLLDAKTYTKNDLIVLDEIRRELLSLANSVINETGQEIFKYCRSACFLVKKKAVLILEEKIKSLIFVQQLINRALKEVEIYQRNGIKIIEIENVGAPYFIGNEIPLEELLILLVVAKSVREKFPKMQMGIQVLSCGELEALPIALACNAFFVRTEASVYKGLRPEGETNNHGNLAKFYYLRNYLNTKLGVELPENRRLPALWCDLQKKHTMFTGALNKLEAWLGNLLFQKMEGIVLTGAETGADISENDLAEARNSINQLKEKINELTGYAVDMEIPLVTGSGSNFKMYMKYADFMIIGTAFKKNNYWENEVDETSVMAIVNQLSN